jgi:hypothetical protein
VGYLENPGFLRVRASQRFYFNISVIVGLDQRRSSFIIDLRSAAQVLAES